MSTDDPTARTTPTVHVVPALRLQGGLCESREEALTVEHPLQIMLNGRPFSVTMRTPGADDLLVKGLLFTEGIVLAGADSLACRQATDPASGLVSTVHVEIPPLYLCEGAHEKRALLASAACGLCGQREFDAAALLMPPLVPPGPLRADRVAAMQAHMHAGQTTFARTGSTHAAAVFDLAGEPLCIYEDIGRHNAVDKAVGHLLQNGLLERAQVLTVSGRLSFEIVSKAYRAGIPYLLAVSAPSSFAVAIAERWGMTVIGYCRDDRFTVYTHPEHVAG